MTCKQGPVKTGNMTGGQVVTEVLPSKSFKQSGTMADVVLLVINGKIK